MTTLHDIAGSARVDVICTVEEGAKRLLLTPGLGVGTPRVVTALQNLLIDYEALAKAAHHSSSPDFALRDLPAAEKESYANAKHLLESLSKLYPTYPEVAK